MKALVTGGCGFIGSNLVDTLVEAGHDVVVYDSETADNDKFYRNDGARYVTENILNFEAISQAMQGRDTVFHFAAESRIGPAIENPRKATEVNAVGTCNVLQAAKDAGVKGLVYSSTSACYGVKNLAPQSENMPFDNLNAYSTSKIAGEDLCLMFAKLYGFPAIALRYFNVFGPRMPTRGQYAPVLAIFIRQALAGEPLTVVGDGLQRRDFIYVGDIVKANILAAKAAQKFAGTVYNVGSGSNNTVLEIAELFKREIKFLPARAGEARATLANLERIKRDLEFRPSVVMMEWLEKEIRGLGILKG